MTKSTINAEVVESRGKRTIHIGIVGMGKMGRIRFDAINDTGSGRIIALMDPDAQRLAGLDHVRIHHTATDLIADPEVEAITGSITAITKASSKQNK